MDNPYTSYIIKKHDSSITRKQRVFKKYPELAKEFERFPVQQLKFLLKRERKLLIFVDLFCALMDLIVVTWMYFDHFDFIGNNYVISPSSNKSRVICIIISMCVCIAINLRFQVKKRLDNIKFILNMRNKSKFLII